MFEFVLILLCVSVVAAASVSEVGTRVNIIFTRFEYNDYDGSKGKPAGTRQPPTASAAGGNRGSTGNKTTIR